MSKRRPNSSSQELATRAEVKQLQHQLVQLKTVVFSGPLPPPEVLAGYEEVVPGAAERIFAMADAQAAHRRQMESRHQAQGGRREWFGMVCGFLLALTAIVGGIYLIANGQPVGGLASVITALTTLAGVFVYARWQKAKELSRKWTQLVGPRGG